MFHKTCLLLLVLVGATFATDSAVKAVSPYGFGGRQYYSSWSYQSQSSYYYSSYYYRPTVTAVSYNYHYAIHYPSQPRYVYYYNPHRQVYWGRLDLEGEKGAQYSILDEKDRKKNLEDIPETAFPKPAEMPKIPESDDGEAMLPILNIPGKDLPSKE